MEISAIEISLLCKRISDVTKEYFLSSVYSMENGILLRLNHATKPERLVAVSSFASWITTKNLSATQASEFVSNVRNEIERAEMIQVQQVGNERIAQFVFQSRKGEKRNLYAEFFSKGNLILTDPAAEDKILEVEFPQTFKHRSLREGGEYRLPPSRGIPLQEVSSENLFDLHSRAMKDPETESLEAVKWFGRNVGTTRKLVEDIFFRAAIDPAKPTSTLNELDLAALSEATRKLRETLSLSGRGYIFLPVEESEEEVDVCSIVPHVWDTLAREGSGTIHEYPSLNEALDYVQVESLLLKKRKKASSLARAKFEELESAIAKQVVTMKRNEEIASELRSIASRSMKQMKSEVDPSVLEGLKAFQIVKEDEESGGRLRFLEEPRSFIDGYSSSSLASRLFDEAKRIERTNSKLTQVINDLESQKLIFKNQSESQEDRAEKKTITERRSKQWFERYRWFFTSDRRLAVGGRDSTSNSIIVNKYTEKNDLVFHADFHGSPFFALKNSGDAGGLSDEIAVELGQATVSFSRAWKDELGSADAYWVLPEQIRKSAPTGEYLARGSFFIEGKKNFVRHLRVELCVGLAIASDLPIFSEETQGPEKENEQLILVCGPEKSLSKYCISRVKIAPGKERASDFAWSLKRQLVTKTKQEKMKEMAKRLTVDDIIRILPSGNYKLISEKQN
jgi:predicted ribosome quality control (RQC) complex YloA/Tae2 family protein